MSRFNPKVCDRSQLARWKTASVLVLAIGVLAVAALGSSLPLSLTRTNRSKLRQPAPIDGRLLALMSQLGMDPSALAVAGLTAEQARTTATQLKDFLLDRAADWDALETAEATARMNLTNAQMLRASGRPIPQGLNIESLQTSLSNLRGSREALLADARAAAVLMPDQAVVVQQVNANRHWPVPIEYMSETRNEQEWVTLVSRLSARDANGNPSDQIDNAAVLAMRQRLANKAAIEDAVMSVARH